jgi:alanine-glyoxylate transaminase/serine-glyoxylate transaminase/serine-pyruvate transaminase
MGYRPGRHFLQIPGPTNVPDRILHAIAYPTIDHRSADFADLTNACLEGMKRIFKTTGHVLIFPGSGTGAWESALVNILSAGDKVLAFDGGHFAGLWTRVANNFGVTVDLIPGDWRHGANPHALEAKLRADRGHEIRAVMVVHNETSTCVTTDIAAIRKAIDAAGHPALLMVDTVSSLGSIDYRHDEWGVDVAVAGSQKGLMLPPGMGFNAISAKAIEASRHATLPRSYWRWDEMLDMNRKGFFPYTPSTNLLYGLREAVKLLLEEEGLENVFRRHKRHAEATRRAVRAWGLEIFALNPAEFSSSGTAIVMPDGFNEADLRAVILRHFDMSLGAGLGKLADKVFRIGHLGSLNDLMLAGTLCGVEMGLELVGVPHRKGGVTEAMAWLTEQAKVSAPQA